MNKICHDCDHCQYIGEGDSICDVEPGNIVLEDFLPGEDFMCCDGKNWVKK